MKKIFSFVVLFLLLMIPISVNASNNLTDKYYVDSTILENGDLRVKELIVVEGPINGYERIINFKNPAVATFNGDLASFRGSDIYNGDSIELVSIKNIPVDSSTNFNSINDTGDTFTENMLAENGDYGVYRVLSNDYSATYRIYNPSTGEAKGIYIEYIIKNFAVNHNDVAELYWSIFTDVQSNYISHLEAHVTVPNNINILRFWAHGPLNGNIYANGLTEVIAKIDNVRPGVPLDLRVAFDKAVISQSTKNSGVDGLNNIVAIETEAATKANNERNAAKAVFYLTRTISLLWIVGLFPLIYFMYNKFDKERSSVFKTKYFRDFPAEYGPEIVGFLFSKSTGNKDLSASIVNLITKKVLTFEETEKGKYSLKHTGKDVLVSKSELKIISWLFDEIGTDGVVTIDQINANAKKDYEKFLRNFNEWKKEVQAEANQRNFFENINSKKGLSFLYALIGIGLSILSFNLGIVTTLDFLLGVMLMIAGIAAAIYFLSISKRTVTGNEDYVRWNGLKNFLNDFGKFENRDLPQVVIWEKYLVYALVFGNADKLAKTMSIKFAEIYQGNNHMMNNMFDIYYMDRIMGMNHSINQGFNNAISTAVSTNVAAHSNSSSGSGFGGGFSGGGGFGGGGGGGGSF